MVGDARVADLTGQHRKMRTFFWKWWETFSRNKQCLRKVLQPSRHQINYGVFYFVARSGFFSFSCTFSGQMYVYFNVTASNEIAFLH